MHRSCKERKLTKLISVLSRRAQRSKSIRAHSALLLAASCASQDPEARRPKLMQPRRASLRPGFRNRRRTPRSSSGVRNPSTGKVVRKRVRHPECLPAFRQLGTLDSRISKAWTSKGSAAPRGLRKRVLAAPRPRTRAGGRRRKSRGHPKDLQTASHRADSDRTTHKMMSAQTAKLRLPSLLKLQSFAM